MQRLSGLVLPILLNFVFTACAIGQVVHRGDCAVDAEIPVLPQCAVETRGGHLYVFKEFLPLFFSPGKDSLSSAFLPESGWAYFDRHGMIVVQNVANFDNGPSAFHHGLVRVNRKGKWGLVDSKGQFIVPLTYDGMLEYEENRKGWRVCMGCRKASDGEHGWFERGNWYWLDRQGRVAGKADDPMQPHLSGNK